MSKRITGIDIRDFKRLKAVHIEVGSEGVITIGGQNMQGKSSVLDAIEATLGGLARSIAEPIRKGQASSAIRVTIPPYRIIRKFESGKTTLAIIDESGVPQKSPSAFLKELVGGCFSPDPMAFLSSQPRDQRKTLLEILGVDTEEIDQRIANQSQRVADAKRIQLDQEARCADYPFYEDLPESPVDTSALSVALEEAIGHNQQLAIKTSSKAHLEETLHRLNSEAIALETRIKETTKLLEQLSSSLASKRKEAAVTSKAIHEETELIAEFKAVDVESIRGRINKASETNEKLRSNAIRKDAYAKWEQAKTIWQEAEEEHKRLTEEKKSLLKNVAYPIPGLGFDDSGVTFNKLPLAQASKAEGIRVAVAISLAQSGHVKPIFIRDASTLDNESMKLLTEESLKAGAQVFCEIVCNPVGEKFDKECTIYIVDGEIAHE